MPIIETTDCTNVTTSKMNDDSFPFFRQQQQNILSANATIEIAKKAPLNPSYVDPVSSFTNQLSTQRRHSLITELTDFAQCLSWGRSPMHAVITIDDHENWSTRRSRPVFLRHHFLNLGIGVKMQKRRIKMLVNPIIVKSALSDITIIVSTRRPEVPSPLAITALSTNSWGCCCCSILLLKNL